MSKKSLAELKEQADTIYQQYQDHFAGKPRATRDLGLISEMIAGLESVLTSCQTLMNGGRNPAVMSMSDTVRENLDRYRQEKKAIEELQRQPGSLDAANLADQANRTFDRYGRHFGGQDRGTRDIGLLEELIADLERIQGQMRSLASGGVDAASRDLQTVESQLQLYRQERANIEAARNNGTRDEIASRLASLANAQFGVYANHFAGKSRSTRRPELLERVVRNLENYRDAMRNLQESGYTSEPNRRNIGIVEDNLKVYRDEIGAIRAARAEASDEEIASWLGGAANEIFGEYAEKYAGKDRRSRDLDRLGVLCDQLAEIARQMREIGARADLEFNTKNLDIVRERWASYENEWRMIREARGIA